MIHPSCLEQALSGWQSNNKMTIPIIWRIMFNVSPSRICTIRPKIQTTPPTRRKAHQAHVASLLKAANRIKNNAINKHMASTPKCLVWTMKACPVPVALAASKVSPRTFRELLASVPGVKASRIPYTPEKIYTFCQ